MFSLRTFSKYFWNSNFEKIICSNFHRERMIIFYNDEFFNEKSNQHNFTINLNIDFDNNFDMSIFLNTSIDFVMITNLHIVIYISIIIVNKMTNFYSMIFQMFIFTNLNQIWKFNSIIIFTTIFDWIRIRKSFAKFFYDDFEIIDTIQYSFTKWNNIDWNNIN